MAEHAAQDLAGGIEVGGASRLLWQTLASLDNGHLDGYLRHMADYSIADAKNNLPKLRRPRRRRRGSDDHAARQAAGQDRANGGTDRRLTIDVEWLDRVRIKPSEPNADADDDLPGRVDAPRDPDIERLSRRQRCRVDVHDRRPLDPRVRLGSTPSDGTLHSATGRLAEFSSAAAIGVRVGRLSEADRHGAEALLDAWLGSNRELDAVQRRRYPRRPVADPRDATAASRQRRSPSRDRSASWSRDRHVRRRDGARRRGPRPRARDDPFAACLTGLHPSSIGWSVPCASAKSAGGVGALRDAARANDDMARRPRRAPRPAHPAAGLRLLVAGAGRLGADLRRRLPGGVRHRPARHLDALRRPAPALDLLPRPLGRAGRRARQPGIAAGRPRPAAALRAGRLRRHRGPAVLPPLRLQPVGHGARRVLQPHPPRRDAAGRLDHHPAAGAQPLPHPHPDHPPQGAGADPGGVAGDQVLQEADPGALSEPGELRRRRLWHRGRLAALFQQAGQRS